MMINLEKQIDDFAAKIENLIATDEEHISNLNSKKINLCLKAQMGLELKWGKIRTEISILHNEAELICETKFSEAFKVKHGDNYADLSTSEAKYYASTDQNYISAKRLENKAYGLKKRVESVVDTIESRKFVLKDLSNLIIAGAEEYIL